MEARGTIYRGQQEVHQSPEVPVEHPPLEAQGEGNSTRHEGQISQFKDRQCRDAVELPKKTSNSRTDP